MKVLSVKQPWAYLICAGYKDIENRSWKTNHRGKLLIHASTEFNIFCLGFLNRIKRNDLIDFIELNWHTGFPRSAIIGEVEITDCIKNSGSIWAEPECWHWVLSNQTLYKEPVLNVIGQLRLWEYVKYGIRR